jgi:hypothetical protein
LEKTMTRILSLALLALTLSACTEDGRETPSFISEAVAAPINSPDYGWRTLLSPTAVEDGAVKDYD